MEFVLIALYFTPLICAMIRRTDRLAGIAVLNVFLGWTLIGWVVSLVWAVSGDKKAAT